MSTLVSTSLIPPLASTTTPVPSPSVPQLRWRLKHHPGLVVLLLVVVVGAVVLLADRLIGTWADQHLFMAWVALWVVVFAGMALLADSVRLLARRAKAALDGWSQSIAQRRAQARLWELAQSDPRLMADLNSARDRASQAEPDFSDALAPLGVDNGVVSAASAWERYVSRLVAQRGRAADLPYI